MSAVTPQLAVDVRALLSRPLSELRGFTDSHGRALTPRQVRAALAAALEDGSELLPVGRTTQFDFTKK